MCDGGLNDFLQLGNTDWDHAIHLLYIVSVSQSERPSYTDTLDAASVIGCIQIKRPTDLESRPSL